MDACSLLDLGIFSCDQNVPDDDGVKYYHSVNSVDHIYRLVTTLYNKSKNHSIE